MAVVLYTTPSCGYCRKTKNYLRERKVKFTEYDVAKNQKKANEMVKKSGQMGVPVLDVNGKIIVGFNQPEIEKALHR
ncbi:MAG: glutaredoxin family protein [Spirochaetaceae bacterium]